VVKLAPDGTVLKTWGTKGGGPGQFDVPHGIALDSAGRVFVADRSNSRVQIFDPAGTFLAEWRQFGRPSAVFIDKNDTLYVADSQTEDKTGCTPDPGCRRGIRIGSAKDGTVKYYIPRANPKDDTSGGEGVAADADGNLFGAENVGKGLRKYARQ
jgi:DNA-binding beta-propeller fold protein YncE